MTYRVKEDSTLLEIFTIVMSEASAATTTLYNFGNIISLDISIFNTILGAKAPINYIYVIDVESFS